MRLPLPIAGPPVVNHQVEQRTTPAGRYWVCLVCEWATDPTPYTDSTAAAAAIRHQLEHRTAGKDIPL